MNDKLPLISIIIPTYNEERDIKRCLDSIFSQNYPKELLEVIVVDNYSRDKTIKLAKEYNVKIFQQGLNRATQLNFGVKKAVGEYILYLDADMILSKNVIQECVDSCENSNYIALYIPEKIMGHGFFGKVRNFERSFYNMTCIDAVRFVKKDKFLEVNGFDENLLFGPDDWDFDRRIKEVGNVHIVGVPIYHNEQEMSLGKYLGKKANYVHTFDKYIQKWGENDRIIKRQLDFWYRYFGVFTEKGKWKRLLRHPILGMGMYILRVMIGMIYLMKNLLNL